MRHVLQAVQLGAALCFLLGPSGGPATRVLFVGNSFTYGNDLPRLVTEQALSRDPPLRLEVRVVAADGMTLERHWEDGEVARLLAAHPWDVLVLQEQSARPLAEPERMASAVRRFAAMAEESGTEVVLFETWAPADRPELQSRIGDAYRRVARSVNATVAPVGTAWSRALDDGSGVTLHAEDGIHAGPAGSSLAASVILETLLSLARPARGP